MRVSQEEWKGGSYCQPGKMLTPPWASGPPGKPWKPRKAWSHPSLGTSFSWLSLYQERVPRPWQVSCIPQARVILKVALGRVSFQSSCDVKWLSDPWSFPSAWRSENPRARKQKGWCLVCAVASLDADVCRLHSRCPLRCWHPPCFYRWRVQSIETSFQSHRAPKGREQIWVWPEAPHSLQFSRVAWAAFRAAPLGFRPRTAPSSLSLLPPRSWMGMSSLQREQLPCLPSPRR